MIVSVMIATYLISIVMTNTLLQMKYVVILRFKVLKII